MERLAATRRLAPRPLASLGASRERLARAYRRNYRRDAGDRGGGIATDGSMDRERYREDGRQLVEALVAHLDADRADVASRSLAEAQAATLVDALARRLQRDGHSLTEAVALFVAARRPFLAELASLGRRRSLDADRLGRLYEDASGMLDRLLLRLIETYQAAAD
jgi:hypothetical protein